MTTDTIEKIETIILPERGIQKDKDGKSFWGYVPYKFTFESKEEYLAWIKVWKHTYNTLSKTIRETKNSRSNAFRNKDANAYKFQYDCITLRLQATTLLEIRKQGKVLSKAKKNEG